ncbi:MAG: 16S rRNA (uracil(1498)-N(3))-methyltransferase [Chloroflexi bacterium]|nr:16S rRNA (uracil(1498)-N(3))-methyltransferase [Chloroflexota bacterium]
MNRFFVPVEWLQGGSAHLQGQALHQIAHVLRLAPGDTIAVLDNSGWEYMVRLERLGSKEATGEIVERRQIEEPRVRLCLYQGLLKSDKFEQVLQKGTELGVSTFVPLLCQRSLAVPSEARLRRWQRILREATEQSRRGRLPSLMEPVSFDQACREARGFSLIPWEEEKGLGLRQALRKKASAETDISLFIGPEGGFTPEEVELARTCGIVPVSLGPRILRAETAGIVAAAAVLYELGELGG